MPSQRQNRREPSRHRSPAAEDPRHPPARAWGVSPAFPAQPTPNDIWDAFELDDESPEPLPEFGDFWGEPDDDKPIQERHDDCTHCG